MILRTGEARPRLADILREIRRIAAGADGKIVCQAEGEDGVMSALVLFRRRGKVVLKFPGQALTDALFAHWQASAKSGRPWAALDISIVDGKPAVSLLDPVEYVAPELEDRIPTLVRRHFGASEWDDSDTEPLPAAKPWWKVW